MSAPTVCKHLLVKGVVQGVGFREAAYHEAKRLGPLKGWVRNISSGDVEVLVQGPEDLVNAFIQWCHRGPAAARVDYVDEKQVKVEPALTSFGIRRL
ncbi:MAG: acylphosphatase [Bdellovibrionota bacterium]